MAADDVVVQLQVHHNPRLCELVVRPDYKSSELFLYPSLYFCGLETQAQKKNSLVPLGLDQGHSQQQRLPPCRRLDHTFGNNSVLSAWHIQR